MTPRPKFASHAGYIAQLPPDARKIMKRMQQVVEAAVPGAERCIGYNMPAYRLDKVFFYFAAFRHHVGVYPPLRGDARLIRALKPYRAGKGNLRFPLAEPMPWDLIGKLAGALAREHGGR